MGVNLETHSCSMTEKKLVLCVFTRICALEQLEHAGSSFAQLMQVCVTSGSEWSEFQKVLFENRYLHSAQPEVNISPKISISAQPLKMALHRNPAMHGSRMVIFLHDSKKALF